MYYRFQRLYAAPTVHQEYSAMETDMIQRFSRCEGVILSGDCRMDSPGFSAVKGTYSLMDHKSSFFGQAYPRIIEIVVGKRPFK